MLPENRTFNLDFLIFGARRLIIINLKYMAGEVDE
jgi:hypothetical protein